MATLSKQAQQKRLEDMQTVADESDPLGYGILILAGVWLLIKLKMAKFTKNQRAMLALITVVLGGAAIIILLSTGMVGFALVIMFVLGIAVAEIRRL